VSLMLRVPLACDLGQVVPQLALLRAMDAVVDLPVAKAAALDPGNAAAIEGPDGATARSRREEAAYSHTVAVLRVLVDPAAPAPGPLEAFQKSVTVADRAPLAGALLRKVGVNGDVHLQHAVFAALIELG
jgi:nuclear pore complex protein Nup155